MAVVEIWTPDAREATVVDAGGPDTPLSPPADRARAWRDLLGAAARCSNASVTRTGTTWVAHGDPMETAILCTALRMGLGSTQPPPLRRVPFDPRRRRMSVIVDGRVEVKGAPDAVLARCVDRGSAEAARRVVDTMAAGGRRVLAVASRSAVAADRHRSADEVEDGLTLIGLLGFEDPPRTDVADAVAACRRAGIRVAMVTGDHPATAAAIATEVGLRGPDDLVIEGRDLPDDDALLGALVDRDGVVIARVDPEQKLRVLRSLQERGHVVAMTGDGVNDGPALQEADIGIAMGGVGTDVARAAADLVLLDDHFATIVAAVEQGRATFTNVHRFLTYHLICNVAELVPFVAWALSGGRLPLALGVLQILCLDLGTDLLPALALGVEPAGPHLLDRPPLARRLIDAALLRRVFLVLGPVEAAVAMTAFIVVLVASGWHPGAVPSTHTLAVASGSAFTAVVLGQMAAAFACRSATRRPGQLGWTGNRLLLVAVAIGLGLLVVFLAVAPVARLLGQTIPTPLGIAVAATAVPAVLIADALQKWARSRNRDQGRRFRPRRAARPG
jgi:magnesium-transporting ATPase (P-type)